MPGTVIKGGMVVAVLMGAAPVWAGPPFLTDDPVPTEPGHWEIYGPLLEAEGRGADFEGAAAVEVNYGAARDVQLTVAVPIAYSPAPGRLTTGLGDLELSVKYRFWNDERRGIQIAAFPGITLPTATNGMGSGQATGLLPVWAQKDAGPWSFFGGGGRAFNPGPGNRDYWTGGIAVSHQVSERLLLGIEVDRHGPDTDGARAVTSLGAGFIWNLPAPFRLLASGGPSFGDGGASAGFHGFVALGIDY